MAATFTQLPHPSFFLLHTRRQRGPCSSPAAVTRSSHAGIRASRHDDNISWMPRDCRSRSSLHGAADVGSLPLKRISRRRGKPWRRWCLGLAHDENWFGLKLKYPAQLDVKNGCLGLTHVGLELGLKLEPRPKLWWWWCLGLKLEPSPSLLIGGGLMAPQTSHPHGPSPC